MNDACAYKDKVNSLLEMEYSRGEIIGELISTFNCSSKTAAKWYNKFKHDTHNKNDFDQVTFHPKQNGQQVITSNSSSDIRTLDELLVTCKVDSKLWGVSDFSIEKTDVNNKDGTFTPKFKVRANLEPNNLFNSKDLLSDFTKGISTYAPKSFSFNILHKDRDCLYILNLHDLHLASLVYKKETSFANYNIDIAKKVFKDAIADLMSKVPKDRVEKIVLICGSDYFNCEDDLETYAGTKVDTDSRYSKMFMDGCKLFIDVIDTLSKDYKVHIVSIPGNHDTISSMHLGYFLHAWYRNAGSRIFIDIAPTARKYVKYHKVIVGFDHGDKTPLKNLPLALINEIPDIGKYKSRTFLTGHRHSNECLEIAGISIRTSPSLSAYTKWATDMGFIGNIRCGQGLLFEKDHLYAIYHSKPVF